MQQQHFLYRIYTACYTYSDLVVQSFQAVLASDVLTAWKERQLSFCKLSTLITSMHAEWQHKCCMPLLCSHAHTSCFLLAAARGLHTSTCSSDQPQTSMAAQQQQRPLSPAAAVAGALGHDLPLPPGPAKGSDVPRINIGVFGVMNAGKSTLMNAITRQETSIVDATPGTTAGDHCRQRVAGLQWSSFVEGLICI